MLVAQKLVFYICKLFNKTLSRTGLTDQYGPGYKGTNCQQPGCNHCLDMTPLSAAGRSTRQLLQPWVFPHLHVQTGLGQVVCRTKVVDLYGKVVDLYVQVVQSTTLHYRK